MTEERQPNTELRVDDLAHNILETLLRYFPTVVEQRREIEKQLRAFAASIQEEAQQPEAEQPPKNRDKVVESLQASCGKMSRELRHQDKKIADLEKQLAEALAERDELAGQVNHDCAFHDELALTNEIHNRFCGENGEPCQVCRLKAEREGK